MGKKLGCSCTRTECPLNHGDGEPCNRKVVRDGKCASCLCSCDGSCSGHKQGACSGLPSRRYNNMCLSCFRASPKSSDEEDPICIVVGNKKPIRSKESTCICNRTNCSGSHGRSSKCTLPKTRGDYCSECSCACEGDNCSHAPGECLHRPERNRKGFCYGCALAKPRASLKAKEPTPPGERGQHCICTSIHCPQNHRKSACPEPVCEIREGGRGAYCAKCSCSCTNVSCRDRHGASQCIHRPRRSLQGLCRTCHRVFMNETEKHDGCICSARDCPLKHTSGQRCNQPVARGSYLSILVSARM